MSFDIRLERLLDATPDVAFHHWIDADARRRWYQGDEHDWVVEAHTDLRVGGRFWVTWGPTPELGYREEGVFLVVEPPHRLMYSSRFTPMTRAEGDAFEVQVTVTFDDESGQTRLRLLEQGYPTAEVRDAFLREGSQQGLDFYERTLPGRQPPNSPRRRQEAP